MKLLQISLEKNLNNSILLNALMVIADHNNFKI